MATSQRSCEVRQSPAPSEFWMLVDWRILQLRSLKHAQRTDTTNSNLNLDSEVRIESDHVK